MSELLKAKIHFQPKQSEEAVESEIELAFSHEGDEWRRPLFLLVI